MTTSRPVPRQSALLPTPLTSFVGRKREVAAVRSLLARPDVRLVTLTGPGGLGKTRLALAVAAEAAGGVADGVRFVPLGAVQDHRLVATDLAPGYYVLLCFVGDPNMGGVPHSIAGMIEVVPVGV